MTGDGGSALTLDQVLAARRGGAEAVIDVDEPSVKLVVFVVENDWYAFHGEKIREILAGDAVFFLPGCPASMEGVINVRGDIESVISLRALLHCPPASPDAVSRILLGVVGPMRSGLRVDRVEEVMDVPMSAIQAPPHTIPDHLRAIVTGIVSFRDHQVAILDLDRLFADYRTAEL